MTTNSNATPKQRSFLQIISPRNESLGTTLSDQESTGQEIVPPSEQPKRALARMFQRRSPLVLALTQPEATPQERMIKGFQRQIQFASTGLVVALVGGLFTPSLAALSVPFLALSSWRITVDGLRDFVEGRPTSRTLVALTIVGAIGFELYAFSALAAIVAVYAYIVTVRVKSFAQDGIVDIFTQRPRTVWIEVDGMEVEVPFETIGEGDTIIIHTSEVIAIDGIIVQGIALVDQHILTGEAQPAEKEVGDDVFASTVVMSGTIHVRVNKTGDETTVAQIGNILSRTMDFKSERQLRAEDWTARTVPPALALTVAVFPFLGINGALSVLYAHPKMKMSLYAPISILNFFRILSEKGILVKDGRTLDTIAYVDTVVFDKTGTLTETRPTVGTVHTYAGFNEEEILALAATAETHQSHPIAQAILKAAKDRQVGIYETTETAYKAGYGLTVTINDSIVRVGSMRFMELEALEVPLGLYAAQERSHLQGHSLVAIAVNDVVAGAIELVPTVRAEAKAVVQTLRDMGINETYIISGDHEMPTRQLAADLGIDHYYAEVLPQDKAAIIEQLQNDGHTVCYIGDGINDSIALKRAAVSVSLSGASTIAVDTAQVILMREDLQQMVTLFEYGKELDDNLRNMFTIVNAPMIIAFAALPFPGINLVVSFGSQIFGLSAGLGWAMLPLARYEWEKRQQQVNELNTPAPTPEIEEGV